MADFPNILDTDTGGLTGLSVDANGNLVVGHTGGSLLGTAFRNILIGETAGDSITSGDDNIHIGHSSATANVAGNRNTIIGTDAGDSFTSGNDTTIVGAGAGATLSAAQTNSIFGAQAAALLTGSSNMIAGYNAFDTATSANNNAIFGSEAGRKITEGDSNVIVGYNAGPTTNQTSKLYINNSESDTPLIGGDFTAKTVTVNGVLSAVSDIATRFATETIYQIGSQANITNSSAAAGVNDALVIAMNAKHATDGTWDAIITNEASRYYQFNGGHYFDTVGVTTAGADITFTNWFTINNDGTIEMGGGAVVGATTLDASLTFDVSGELGSRPWPNLNITQRDAITSPVEGSVLYQVNNNLLNIRNSGGFWTPIDSITGYNAQTGTTYTLVGTDGGHLVTMSNASANTLTIPTNASVAFPLYTRLEIVMLGAGTTSVAGDTGVTLNGVSAGSGAIANQYQGICLTKIGTDTWLASGDIGAVA